MTLDMKILKESDFALKNETHAGHGFQKFVGKTGRTVSRNEVEIQYIVIIGKPLLTYLLTGTDRLERTNGGFRTCVLIQFGIKVTKLSTLGKKSDIILKSTIRKLYIRLDETARVYETLHAGEPRTDREISPDQSPHFR